jgi:SAM-dependent methyltransferase
MSKLVFLPCPLCKSTDESYAVKNTDQDEHLRKYGELYDGVAKSGWRTCGNCGFVHQNPRPSIDDLNRFYLDSKYHPPGIPDYWQAAENYIEFAAWYYSEKMDYALHHSGLRTGSVFDIGFGQGGVLKLFADRGWQALGVESDKIFLDYARTQLGLDLIQEGILHGNIEIQQQVDLVFSNHTFEHVADLHDAMAGLQRVLKPGGYVFTAIPTYYQNRSRTSLEWLNSAHYSMFTHRSLNQLFSYYGLEEVAHTYRGWKKEIDDLWHVARFTGRVIDPKKFYENPRKVRRYINVINPINSIIWYPIYANYAGKVQTYESVKRRITYGLRMLGRSPRLFFLKAAQHLKKRCLKVFKSV